MENKREYDDQDNDDESTKNQPCVFFDATSYLNRLLQRVKILTRIYNNRNMPSIGQRPRKGGIILLKRAAAAVKKDHTTLKGPRQHLVKMDFSSTLRLGFSYIPV